MLAHLTTPGSSFTLLPYIQGITLLLLLLCCGALYLGVAVVHMCVMIFLSLGLLCSVSFVAREYDNVVKREKDKEKEDKEKKEDGGGKAAEGRRKTGERDEDKTD